MKAEIRSSDQGVLRIDVLGPIDESMENLDKLIGEHVREIHLNCKNIDRIASIGVLNWIRCFAQIRAKGIALKFYECSPAIIRNGAMITGRFLIKEELISLALPYYCELCDIEFAHYMDVSALAHEDFRVPEIPCVKCRGTTIFDDDSKSYFSRFRPQVSKAVG